MRYYFHLQVQILLRQLKSQGIPLMLFVAIVVTLLAIAYYALQKITFAPYILLYLTFGLLNAMQTRKRIEFLNFLFVDKVSFLKVRFIENLIFIFPCIILAITTSLFWIIPFVLALYLFYSLQTKPISLFPSRSFPTPFAKYPFEMIQFFRIYLIAIIIEWLLFCIAMVYKNQNLALFAIAIIPFFTLSNLEKTEPITLLWNYTMTPKQFLIHKIRRILLQSYALITPLAIVLLGVDYSNLLLFIILLFYVLIALLITLILFIKYSIFPRKMGILEGIIFACSALLPVFVIGLFPYYYFKAIKNLKKFVC